jgi:hypothetical protein
MATLSAGWDTEARRAEGAPRCVYRHAAYAFGYSGCGYGRQDAKGVVRTSLVRLLPKVALGRTHRQHGTFHNLEANTQTFARRPA